MAIKPASKSAAQSKFLGDMQEPPMAPEADAGEQEPMDPMMDAQEDAAEIDLSSVATEELQAELDKRLAGAGGEPAPGGQEALPPMQL